MSDTLLSIALTAAALRIGESLPAAYNLDAGALVMAGDTNDHAMPEGATAVRWSLGGDDGFLVVALTDDVAQMLQDEGGLVQALTDSVELAAVDLAALFDGVPPTIGEGEEVEVGQALDEGPGDAVSLPLLDAGTHRFTVGMRLVISDALLAPPPVEPQDGPVAADPASTDAPAAGDAGSTDDVAPSGGQHDGSGPMAPVQSLLGSGGSRDRRAARAPAPVPVGNAHPADFASFDQLSSLPSAAHSMALLGDVEMGVTAELGRTELTVREILSLTPGTIIELDRAAGSPVDVVVNGTLIARGEVVVIDEEFGIRITEILGMTDQASPFPVAQ